jgi:ABC-type dipeptide/oligopeptide/nickel transport system permease component
MKGYLARRTGAALIVLLISSMIVFAGIRALPGDTARALAGDAGFPTPGRIASWSGAAAASAELDSGGAVFHVGDDVIHATLGDGVVTGTEPGGVVVVRFAGEGRDRKLMADYAPLRKR